MIEKLMSRLNELWLSGDDAVLSNYRELNDEDLLNEYAWVLELSERQMMVVRGILAPPLVTSITVVKGLAGGVWAPKEQA
tara:strand:+ start:61 stop:300 length:240 start_codon:yes stop_codon:yes gene_type:complete